jgi:hypothetical protein
MTGMGKVFDLLNKINGLKIPKSDRLSFDSGLNAKVKVGETVIISLGKEL